MARNESVEAEKQQYRRAIAQLQSKYDRQREASGNTLFQIQAFERELAKLEERK